MASSTRARALSPLVSVVALVVSTTILPVLPLGAQSAGVAQERASSGTNQGPPSLSDLRMVLDTGVVLQDRNGDDVVDFVDTRILLGSNPTEAEVAAAANLAARLGYETSAVNLGLVGSALTRDIHTSPVFLVGSGAVDGAGIGGEMPAGLAPGQGVVAHLAPGDRFRAGAVAVVGYDATGLLEAAAYFSGRYPGVWAPDGTAWAELAEKVEAFAEGLGVGDAGVTLDRIVIDGSRPGVARARLTVEVAGDSAYQAVVDAFEGRGEEEDSLKAEGEEAEEEGAEEEAAKARAGDPAEESAADSAQAGEGGRPEKRTKLSDLEVRNLHRIDVLIVAPGQTKTVTLRPEEPWETRPDGAVRAGSDASFTLPELYSVGGLYRDTNRDLVPDESSTYLSLSGPEAPAAVADFATRIGLETAGIRLPLAKVASQEDDPAAWGFPILLGTDHYQIRRLREDGNLPATEVSDGEGFVQFVDGAFGDRNAMAVGAADEAGLGAVTDWLARRAPYLWTHGKGEYRLADVETEVRRFLQGVKAPGQVALALTKLGTWMDRMKEDSLSEGPPSRVEVELAALEVPSGLAGVAEAVIRERFPNAQIDIQTWPTDFGVGDTIFVQEWDIPWEVDEARELLEREVYGNLRAGAPVNIELRVSEPPEIRAELEEEIRNRLADAGVRDATVHVLSAYKQGYSWINDVILPRLRGQGVGAIELTYHTLLESEEVRWQTIAAETRWLQEVYPIDAVLARELGVSDSVMTFHPTRQKDPIYTLEARDTTGSVILRETFDPRYVIRPFFDLFPEYEQIRVTTGWITASSGSETLVDRRIATDPERFWDRLQTETYREIIDYIMDSQDGDPSGGNAPFFDVFEVDLRLSEPDYRIGVDEEIISSLEALHEDIYFETHTLFSLLGGRYQTSLSNPGRVLPFVDPSGAGQPGRARLSLTGKEEGNPKLAVRTWASDEAEPILKEYELGTLSVDDPALVGAVVAEGSEGVEQLLLRVTVPDSLDRYQEFAARSSESGIDRQFLSVEMLEGMTRSLRRLHDAGLFQEALSWDRVGGLVLDFRLEKDSLYQHTVTMARSQNPKSTDNPRLAAGNYEYGGEPLVQWDTPISLEESAEILGKLGTFPEVSPYYLTETFLGHQTWAADFLPPHEAEFISQAKRNALKPTIFISGREHANEVSATSHILRLGELLVTDSAHRAMLDKVNVVLHPIANPDGASLAYARQLVNPNHMLHAGRPGALGSDATSGGGSADPLYPEAKARSMIREAWLPDIYLNPHGYPSHEWVQYFAGYSAWARGRRVGARTWWVPRGWFIPGFSWVEDEDNPDYQTAQFAILDSMAAAMTRNEEVHSVNRRMYDRYKKYGEQENDGFTEYLHNGMVVSMSLKGAESIGQGLNSRRVTYFSVTTEAPDETARGDYMDVMGQAGLAHTTSALRYLANGEFEVEREAEAFDGAVIRKVFRVKPVVPKGKGVGSKDAEGDGQAMDPSQPIRRIRR